MSDCVFYVETNYQFLQSLALILDWRDRDCFDFGKNIYIIDGTKDKVIFSKRNTLESEFNVRVINVKVYPFYFSAIFSFLITYRFRRFIPCSFFMFNNRSPIVNKLSSLFSVYGDVIQVEEGLSLYRKKRISKFPKNILLLLKRIFVSSVTFSKFTDHIGHTSYSDTVFVRYASLVHDNEFLVSKKLVQLPSLKKLSPVSSVLNRIYSYDNSKLPDRNYQYVIFFGQPLSELGILNRNVELELFAKIEDVVRSLGFKFIVKVHPSEDKSKYKLFNVELISGDVPAEVVFLNFSSVKSVVSFYSTAALNVSDLLGVPAYFIYEGCGLDVKFPSSKCAIIIKSFGREDLFELFSSD